MTDPSPGIQPGLTGLCEPWISGADVSQRPGCEDIDAGILESSAWIASEILYNLSGRRFNGGGCPATVRPVATPHGLAIWGIAGVGWYSASWGVANGTSLMAGVPGQWGWFDSHVTVPKPAHCPLGAYPVTAITQVLIDGVVIPADEYRVDNNRELVRMLPAANAVATEMWGWPYSQRLDLPSTEPGTFEVQFTFGAAPSNAGIQAASVYAAEIAKAGSGAKHRLPQRVTNVQRQGVNAVVIDSMDLIEKGRTGLPEVDLWVKTVNPEKLTRRSQVWSPDLGRPRRMG
jgi:hypothetical protein